MLVSHTIHSEDKEIQAVRVSCTTNQEEKVSQAAAVLISCTVNLEEKGHRWQCYYTGADTGFQKGGSGGLEVRLTVNILNAAHLPFFPSY